jgi:hypothetical protein
VLKKQFEVNLGYVWNGLNNNNNNNNNLSCFFTLILKKDVIRRFGYN